MVPDHLVYLCVNAGVIIVPFIASFHPKLAFFRRWRAFFPACVLVLIPFIIWDIAFTKQGIWGFNERYVTGTEWIGLPLEEWLFFVCIPYACVFTFHAFSLVRWKVNVQAMNTCIGIMGLLLVIIAGINYDKAYTLFAFGLCGVTLIFLALVDKAQWLPRGMFTYLLVLPFFFISNGILTGTWIEEEIVWYNNAENLGIRMGTIPVEDTFYGMLLVVLNMMLFQRLR